MTAPVAPRDPTERFGDRVDEYERHRPGYPTALVDHLRADGWLPERAAVADVGGGTGLSSVLFLDAGCSVACVEPNAAMRAAAQRELGARAGFVAVEGRAESTTLADASVDLVAAGTAFHWFEPAPTRREFARILRPNGGVALFWNKRARGEGFMADYERVLFEYCPGYADADARRRGDEASVRAFFGPGSIERQTFVHCQRFGFDGLLGRVSSSSYAPRPGSTAFEPLRAALLALFERHAKDGEVRLDYDTVLYLGRVA